MFNSKTNKLDDALSNYNSLRDPHLKPFFRRPTVRKHLIKANIINQDNKIVDEIMKTKHQQRLEHEKRKALYQLLKEISHRHNAVDNLSSTDLDGCSKSYDDLLKQAQTVIDGHRGNRDKDRDDLKLSLLRRLDRMIKIIQSDSSKASSKSYYDFSPSRSPWYDNSLTKSCSSTTEPSGTKHQRPKSSYGRSKALRHANSQIDLDAKSAQDSGRPKSKSTNNLLDEEDIESLEGESLTGSEPAEHANLQLDLPCAKKLGQQVKMTLRFDSLSTASVLSRRSKRNVRVFQQIKTGGNSILLLDRFVSPGELFTFVVRPHPRTPFSIVVFVNAIRDMQINTCCELKHKRNTRLCQFTLVDVVGAQPCLACQNGQSVENLVRQAHGGMLTSLNKPRHTIKLDWNDAEPQTSNKTTILDEAESVVLSDTGAMFQENGDETIDTNDVNQIIMDGGHVSRDNDQAEDIHQVLQFVSYDRDEEEEDNLREFIALEKQLEEEEEEENASRSCNSSVSSTVDTVKLNEASTLNEDDKEKGDRQEDLDSLSTECSEYGCITEETIPSVKHLESDDD